MSKHIKRSKINRSYDGLDREEKTGGLMAMRVIVILLIIAFVAFCVAMLVYNIIEENNSLSDSDTQTTVRYRSYTEEEAEELIRCCNASSPLSDSYTADTVEYKDGISVNKLMAEDLERMISKAHEEGIEIVVTKGYEDAEECDREFNSLKYEFQSSGATLAEAESRARAIFPPSQMNEYRTGLLIKVSDDDSYAFSKTKTYQWLYKNGTEYGFINRYTEDKETRTGIDENLTVYRYVGAENAAKMRSYGMCLEEYYDYCSYR